MGGVIFALFMIFVVMVLLIVMVRSIKIQHEGEIGLVESWGRFTRVIIPGRYLLLPWEHISGELPLQIFEYTTDPQKLVLKGGSPLTLSVIIYYQIEHAHRTPGAPRPARIIGTEPAPIGTVAVGRSPVPATALAMAGPARRSGVGLDSLEPMARSQAQRHAVPPAVPRSRTTTTVIRRVLGRTDEKLDIAQAAYRAKYLVEDWQEATRKEAVATLQQVFSKVNAGDDIFGNVDWQETLGERVREHLTTKTERWGVQIIDVAFKDVTFSDMTMQNMYAEPRAEREARIRTKEAENYKRIAELLQLTPAQLLSWRQVEIMRELAKSPSPRVMFTNPIGGDTTGAAPPMPTGAAGVMDAATTQAQPQLNPGALPNSVAVPDDRGMIAPSLRNVDQQ
jgi:regulator of protease activity HflC (stomatin/prohibitin superfamily)